MFKTSECIKNDKGFTLVELMVTVFLTAIAVISIYRGYTAFSQSADAQQQVMEMQQNLRIGMTRLAVDIRRAGMNEESEKDAGFLCDEVPTNDTSIEFSMDLGSGGVFASDGKDNDDDGGAPDEEDESRIGDGDTEDDGEKIIYYLAASSLDPTTNDLIREVWTAGAYVTHTLITNVEALDFVYFDDTPAELVPSLPTAAECLYGVGGGELSLKGDELQEVDRVEITLVVRATNEDYRYTNRGIYRNLQGEEVWPLGSPSDNFRRRVFSMSVQIRNNI
jgi:prepilin-type N-terminal cleavage/methylation domain-containing protein